MLRVANLSRKVACRLSQYTDQSYRAIVESVLDVIVRLSPELRYQYVTPNALDILGYHPDELVGKPFREFVHPEDLIEIGRSGVLDEFFSRSLTFRFMRKDGGTVWIETRCRDIYVGDQVAETISVFRDITERKVSEWELNQSVKRYQAVVDSSIDAIVVADRNFQVVSVNPAATAMFGYPPAELVGQSMDLLVPERSRERARRALRRFAEDPSRLQGRRLEFTGRRRDGSEFPAEVAPNTWQVDGDVWFSAVLRDLTEQKRLHEQALSAEKLSTVGQLSASIVHEIRNPIGVVTGLLEYLGLQFPQGKDTVSMALGELHRVERMVQSLLAASKPVEPRFEEVCVSSFLESLQRLLAAQAAVNQVRLEVRCGLKVPKVIRADKDQLTQLALNFIKNGIEAMPDGGVMVIGAEHRGDDMVLEFQDQGTGISKETLTKLGNPFFTTKPQGTGLGFMVCQQIARNHGGDIRIKSEVGKGTTISVILPLNVVVAEAG